MSEIPGFNSTELALKKLVELDNVVVETEPATLFFVVGLLQLALKHPDVTGPYFEVGHKCARQGQEMLSKLVPEINLILEEGWIDASAGEPIPEEETIELMERWETLILSIAYFSDGRVGYEEIQFVIELLEEIRAALKRCYKYNNSVVWKKCQESAKKLKGMYETALGARLIGLDFDFEDEKE